MAISEFVKSQYFAHRKNGASIQWALINARKDEIIKEEYDEDLIAFGYDAEGNYHSSTNWQNVCEFFEDESEQITFRLELDRIDQPDLSWLGEIKKWEDLTPRDHTRAVEISALYELCNDKEYFVPGCLAYEDYLKEFSRQYGRHEADCLARKSIQSDKELALDYRAEEWWYVGVSLYAYHTETWECLASAGLSEISTAIAHEDRELLYLIEDLRKECLEDIKKQAILVAA